MLLLSCPCPAPRGCLSLVQCPAGQGWCWQLVWQSRAGGFCHIPPQGPSPSRFPLPSPAPKVPQCSWAGSWQPPLGALNLGGLWSFHLCLLQGWNCAWLLALPPHCHPCAPGTATPLLLALPSLYSGTVTPVPLALPSLCPWHCHSCAAVTVTLVLWNCHPCAPGTVTPLPLALPSLCSGWLLQKAIPGLPWWEQREPPSFP